MEDKEIRFQRMMEAALNRAIIRKNKNKAEMLEETKKPA